MFSMFRKMICLVSFVLVLGLVGNVQAQTATWTDAGDHLWSTPENWSEFSTPAHWAKVRNGPPGATVANEGALASRVHVGYEEGSALTVDGGTLVISGDDLLLGKNGGSATLNMISGTITVARDFEVGGGDPGIVNMAGGTIIVGDDFMIPETISSTAEVNLDGGTIIINGDLTMRADGGTMNGTLNITGGTLIIDADALSTVQGYIDNGWITAYGGNGTVALDYDVTNEGQTTLKGVHKLNPNPVNGGFAAPGAVELSWTLPDPCVPGQPVPVDVYFTDDLQLLEQFTDPAAIQVVNKQNVTSVVVQTQPKTRYYWAVDAYVDSAAAFPVVGPIFSFVPDNMPPEVDAGADIVTWLEGDTRIGNLDATVIDDGSINPYTVQWTVINAPNEGAAVIETATAEDTGITLTALGMYALQLDAFDGEYSGSDMVTINVYSDSCQAAQSLPDYVPLVGELNGDCRIDEADLALLEESWLQDNSLTEEWLKVD